MGLVRKAKTDSVAVEAGGSVDISALIRQAVTDEIERQRLKKLETDGDPDAKHDSGRVE
jgi:hypothetical protein